MTKTSIFGQSEVKQEEKKPIEFVKSCLFGNDWEKNEAHPSEYENIVLLEKNYNTKGFDLMWAYDAAPNHGTLYLGHWNDGIVK